MLRGRETVGGGHGMVKRYVFEDESCGIPSHRGMHVLLLDGRRSADKSETGAKLSRQCHDDALFGSQGFPLG